MSEDAAICLHCGVPKEAGDAFCPTCGAQPDPKAIVCVKCGTQLKSFDVNGQKPDGTDSQRNEKLVNRNVRTFGEAIGSCFRKYAVFSGRACRAEFWWWVLFCWLVLFLGVAGLVKGLEENDEIKMIMGFIGMISMLIFLLPTLAVTVRRLHDTGRSGGFYFISLIPVIGVLILLSVLLGAPDPQTNRYGTNPLDA